jgi:hypothetical protein
MTRGSAFRAANGARSSGTHSRRSTRSQRSRGTARPRSGPLGSVRGPVMSIGSTLIHQVGAARRAPVCRNVPRGGSASRGPGLAGFRSVKMPQIMVRSSRRWRRGWRICGGARRGWSLERRGARVTRGVRDGGAVRSHLSGAHSGAGAVSPAGAGAWERGSCDTGGHG